MRARAHRTPHLDSSTAAGRFVLSGLSIIRVAGAACAWTGGVGGCSAGGGRALPLESESLMTIADSALPPVGAVGAGAAGRLAGPVGAYAGAVAAAAVAAAAAAAATAATAATAAAADADAAAAAAASRSSALSGAAVSAAAAAAAGVCAGPRRGLRLVPDCLVRLAPLGARGPTCLPTAATLASRRRKSLELGRSSAAPLPLPLPPAARRQARLSWLSLMNFARSAAMRSHSARLTATRRPARSCTTVRRAPPPLPLPLPLPLPARLAWPWVRTTSVTGPARPRASRRSGMAAAAGCGNVLPARRVCAVRL